MKKNIFRLTHLLLSISLFHVSPTIAQPNTLYFMKGIPQTKDLNPARPGIENGWYLSLPLFSKLDLSANTNNWSYNDLIHKGTGPQADSLVWDFDNYLSAIGKSNFINESAALTVLEAGLKRGKNFYAFSLTDRQFAEFYFEKNLVNLIYYGNHPYLGSTYNSGVFGIGAQHYRELAFTFARDVSEDLTVGVTAKVLFGMAAIKSNGLNFKAASPATGEYLDVTASGRVDVSAPLEYTYGSNGYLSSVDEVFEANDYFLNFGNPGIAVDLGFAYKVNDNFEYSMSLIDFGTINWTSNTASFIEQGQFKYRGIEIANPANTPPTITSVTPSINQLEDSIRDAFRPDTLSNSFSTMLPAKLYIGGDYMVNDNLSVSGLARLRIYNNAIRSSFTASANALIWKGVSLSASYSIMESTFDNLGLGLGFRGGPFQIYAAADNIVSPFYPAKAKNMNLRVGINLIFPEKEDKHKGGKGRRVSTGGVNRCPLY